MHLESFWQAAHSLGHFSSMHCWGSSITTSAVEISFFLWWWSKQWLSWAHFIRFTASWFPFWAKHVWKQFRSSLHCLSHYWIAGKHFGSSLHACSWSGHFSYMHCFGSAGTTAVEIFPYFSFPKQWFAAAHFATLSAAWSPFWAKHIFQQLSFEPHFFSQSWRVGMHLESFWHAAHSLGHFSSMHCWGSTATRGWLARREVVFSTRI